MLFCTMHPKNCTMYGMPRTEERCGRCGFNLDEYNARIADIREHGLRTLKNGLRGYVVKKERK